MINTYYSWFRNWVVTGDVSPHAVSQRRIVKIRGQNSHGFKQLILAFPCMNKRVETGTFHCWLRNTSVSRYFIIVLNLAQWLFNQFLSYFFHIKKCCSIIIWFVQIIIIVNKMLLLVWYLWYYLINELWKIHYCWRASDFSQNNFFCLYLIDEIVL